VYCWLQEYKVGEHILARWSDCKMYPAKVVAVNDNGKWFISINNLFYYNTLAKFAVLVSSALTLCGSATRKASSLQKTCSSIP